MKDDILKFRKICDVLMKEQKYTQGKLCAEKGFAGECDNSNQHQWR